MKALWTIGGGPGRARPSTLRSRTRSVLELALAVRAVARADLVVLLQTGRADHAGVARASADRHLRATSAEAVVAPRLVDVVRVDVGLRRREEARAGRVGTHGVAEVHLALGRPAERR